jgi:PrtD family type I secretion system ABC transporter
MPLSALDPLRQALASCKRIVASLSAMSCIINVLMLTGSLYMLQVYDRVLTSHSVPTLVALSLLVAGLYAVLGLLDVLRSQILVRVASAVNERLAPLAHLAAIRAPLSGASQTEAGQPVRDVDTLRGFLSGQGPIAMLDLPWMPIYIVFAFALHSLIGWLTVAGVLALVLLTFATERKTEGLNRSLGAAAAARNSILENDTRNAEVIKAMGLGPRAGARFNAANAHYLAVHSKASDVAGAMGGLSKIMRMVLQSATLGLGAFLVLEGEMTGGAIIAASIAASRALAPIELAIGQWKSFVAARQSFARLKTSVAAATTPAPVPLPAPTKTLRLENVAVAVPRTQRLLLNGINLELTAGQGLGIIGPSAAGKSTLARTIAGVMPLARGSVRLDGATLDRWQPEVLGRSVGYLPQDVQLFDGTIAENISRFEEQPDGQAIIAAACAADVHEMILRLPDGYETRVGAGSAVLSAGQRQRLALARALYRNPFLVVLDEPNSNLDAEGEAALTRAIAGVRERGGIAIIIAHRPTALAAVDLVAVMTEGQLASFGPKEQVLRSLMRNVQTAA